MMHRIVMLHGVTQLSIFTFSFLIWIIIMRQFLENKTINLIFCCCFPAAFITISVIMFGVKADVDRQWLPNPDSNFLSWSFGFCILSGFFSIFAGMCLLSDYLRIGIETKRSMRDPAYAPKPNPRYWMCGFVDEWTVWAYEWGVHEWGVHEWGFAYHAYQIKHIRFVYRVGSLTWVG